MSVSSGGVAGIRWYELNHATSGAPSFVQQSTYQPADTTWRWMGSAAMDRDGNLALGYSASSATIHPEIRYAGRLAADPASTLAQGEATLHAGTGSQLGTNNRWGDYSDMTVDPADGCTFWYTQEYYSSPNAVFAWKTRIGNFRFPAPDCGFASGAHLSIQNASRATRVRVGSHLDFDVTLINAGPATATGVVVTDNLPAGPGVDWALDATASDSGWSVVGSPPNEHLVGPATLNPTTLSHAHVVSSTGSTCRSFTNTASFTSTNGGSGSASASTAVACQTLSVAKAGTGAGTVSSSPVGIGCGATCSAVFLDGTSVTLTATPATGSSFAGWSGACTGAGACVVPMNAAKAVTATFNLQPRTLAVRKTGTGTGRVTSSPTGISCPGACSFSFLFGTSVKLTAKPSIRAIFSGWSGACRGTAPCVLSMTANRAATATFKAKCVVPKVIGLTLRKAKAKIKKAHCGVGKVTQKPSPARKKGKVLGQKPRPGRKLRPGARVNLTVGKG
jgi:uncharacterized repeat protein (TIGR01451 family)